MGVYIECKDPSTAIRDYFYYYTKSLKIGIIISVTGGQHIKMGVGKSYASAVIGESIDPTFDIKKVVYTPKETLEVMDYVESLEKDSQFFMLDEGEITAPAHMYLSFYNKVIFYSFATFRYLKAVGCVITPSLSWLDKRIRTLVSHWGYTTKEIEGHKLRVKLHLYSMTTDLFGDKIYIKKISMFDQSTKRTIKFNNFNVGLPSDSFIQAYEKKSMDFKKNLRKQLIPEIEKFEKRSFEHENKTPQQIIDEIMNDPVKAESIMGSSGKINTDLLRTDYDIKTGEAIRIKKIIETMWKGKK